MTGRVVLRRAPWVVPEGPGRRVGEDRLNQLAPLVVPVLGPAAKGIDGRGTIAGFVVLVGRDTPLGVLDRADAALGVVRRGGHQRPHPGRRRELTGFGEHPAVAV